MRNGMIFVGLFAVLLAVVIALPVHAEDGDDDGLGVTVTANTGNGSANTTLEIDDDDSDDSGSDDSDDVEDDNSGRGSRGPLGARMERRGEARENGSNVTGPRPLMRFAGNMSVNGSMRDRREYRKEMLDQLKERRDNLREHRKDTVEKIREELKEHHERIQELRSEYKDAKDEFKNAAKQLKDRCVANNATNSTLCRDARSELNGKAKEFMGNAAEQMLRIINATRTRVEANTNIDNETAADIIERLDDDAQSIAQAQAKLDALTNSSDVNATKAAAAELRAAWMNARVTIRLSEGLLVHSRFQELLDNLNTMETRFKQARDNLSASGKDVTQLDADIVSFSAKIDAASEGYAEVKASYIAAMDNATTEAQANALLKDTREKIQETRKELDGARQDLRAIIKDLRELSREIFMDVVRNVRADSAASSSVDTDVEVDE